MTVASLAWAGLLSALCGCVSACGDHDGVVGSSGATGGEPASSSGNAGAGDGGRVDGGNSEGAAAAAAGAAGLALEPGPASQRQTARPSGSVEGTSAGYWEYLPPHYGDGALYPLLVFRHGAGQNGNGTTELPKVLKHGPPMLIASDQWPAERPFIVLSVQHPGSGCPSAQEIGDFLSFALGHYDVDPRRVYLTGLSCGANGSWNYLGEHLNELVAASVLIAGDARAAFAKRGCLLGVAPIWAFHGDMDPTVPAAYDAVPIASLEQCDPAPVDLKYTSYPGVQHNSWTMTYDLSNPDNDIYAWLLSHAN